MARVTFEETAFVAARRIAKHTGMTARAVAGMLVLLWHDSQALECTQATRADLVVWLDFDDGASDSDVDEFIAAMVSTKLLSLVSDGVWKIEGNDKHIANLRQRKEAASIGGKVSALVRSKHTLQANASTETKRPVEPSTVQYSAVQYSSEHKKKKESSDPKLAASVAAHPDFFKNEKLIQVLEERGVTQGVAVSWLNAYPDSRWVAQEVFKALAWEAANPAKKKKQFGRFIANWLGRGWDNSRANLPSNPVASFGGTVQPVYDSALDPALSGDDERLSPEADEARRAVMAAFPGIGRGGAA